MKRKNEIASEMMAILFGVLAKIIVKNGVQSVDFMLFRLLS